MGDNRRVRPDDPIGDDPITATLREHWNVRPSAVTRMPAGWMSCAWDVREGDRHFVARRVDHVVRQPFEAGLAAALHLGDSGVAIGEPVRTLAGALAVADRAGVVGLVRRVPGEPLDGTDPAGRRRWGEGLAAAHRALDGFAHRGPQPWHWLQPDAPHLAVEPWLRPAVTDAVAALTRLTVADQLTYGVLHGDPAPAAFVVDGRTGGARLLDWGPCGTGPLVYDLAAAVAYAGGPDRAPELIHGYTATGVVGRDEVDVALPVLLRFRAAVRADWHARRLAAAGQAAGPDDRAGLVAAREALEAPC